MLPCTHKWIWDSGGGGCKRNKNIGKLLEPNWWCVDGNEQSFKSGVVGCLNNRVRIPLNTFNVWFYVMEIYVFFLDM